MRHPEENGVILGELLRTGAYAVLEQVCEMRSSAC